MSKLRLLDLFSGAGGCAYGYMLAGFHVTGVDIAPQPHYVGDAFVQADALTFPLNGYDLIHASPPCQRFSHMTPMDYRAGHPDHLSVMLERLRQQPTPYIVENVAGARDLMDAPVMLCGTMFGLPIQRHRYFTIGNADVFFLLPSCNHSEIPILITGRGMRFVNGKRPSHVKIAIKREAIGIDWMTDDEITEAIPPVYTKFLGERLLEHMAVEQR